MKRTIIDVCAMRSFVIVVMLGASALNVYFTRESRIKENRRYIREVIQPSYNISDAWANPHFDAWLKQGGWADAPSCPFAK